jgi:hypothetical protein
MNRVHWRAVALLAVWSAVWWWLLIAPHGCDRPRPTEEAPAGQEAR